MKIVSVKFDNYYRTYAFKTKLNLNKNKRYFIIADGIKYSTPVIINDYLDTAPTGIKLKEITKVIAAE